MMGPFDRAGKLKKQEQLGGSGLPACLNPSPPVYRFQPSGGLWLITRCTAKVDNWAGKTGKGSSILGEWQRVDQPDQWKCLDVHHQGALCKVQKISSCCYCFLAGTWRCLVWWDVGNVAAYTCFSKQLCTMDLKKEHSTQSRQIPSPKQNC